MDEKSEGIKRARATIEDAIGLPPATQKKIKESVINVINNTETIFEGMRVLQRQNGMDPESILAGTILGSITAPRSTTLCLAVPVDLIDMLRGGEDDTQLSAQEEAEIAKILRKNDAKIAD